MAKLKGTWLASFHFSIHDKVLQASQINMYCTKCKLEQKFFSFTWLNSNGVQLPKTKDPESKNLTLTLKWKAINKETCNSEAKLNCSNNLPKKNINFPKV